MDQSIDRDNDMLNYARINKLTLQAWSPFQKGFFDGVFLGDRKDFAELNDVIDALAKPQQFMAQQRTAVDEAFAGDVVGPFDPGMFRIGDTLTDGAPLQFTGFPRFPPALFAPAAGKDAHQRQQPHKGRGRPARQGTARPRHGAGGAAPRGAGAGVVGAAGGGPPCPPGWAGRGRALWPAARGSPLPEGQGIWACSPAHWVRARPP